MSKTVRIHKYNPALTTTPVVALEPNAQIDWLELENRTSAGTLLFYWLEPDATIVEPPTDPDAWHSLTGARQSEMRHAQLWVRSLSGTVHYVLTAG